MKIKQIFKRKIEPKAVSIAPNNKMQLVYIDNECVEYYSYKNFIDLPAIRGIAIEKATRFAGMNINEENLKIALAEMKQAGNKQDWVKVFSIVQDLEFRLKLFAEEQTLLKIAALYFLQKGEDEININEELINAKIKRWEQDQQAKDFFLTIAYKLIKKHSDLSENDLVDYLQETKQMLEKLNINLSKQK